MSSEDTQIKRNSLGWLVAGFGALGLLIGNLVGLTSESLVAKLINLLFVFVGGSVLAFLRKLTEDDRRVAGAALLSLSLACILGVYVSIFVTEFRLLSPQDRKKVADVKYVRDATVSRAAVIDGTKDEHDLKSAYQKMYDLALEYEQRLKDGK